MNPDSDPPGEREDAPVIPTEDEEGKDVVDMHGRDIGTVAAVEGDTMYVAPDTSVTEQVKSRLGWGGESEDELPVPPEFVGRIEDEVVLDVERDEEFQERSG